MSSVISVVGTGAMMPRKAKPQPIDGLTFEQAFAEPEASVRALEESLALYEYNCPGVRMRDDKGILLWKN